MADPQFSRGDSGREWLSKVAGPGPLRADLGDPRDYNVRDSIVTENAESPPRRYAEVKSTVDPDMAKSGVGRALYSGGSISNYAGPAPALRNEPESPHGRRYGEARPANRVADRSGVRQGVAINGGS